MLFTSHVIAYYRHRQTLTMYDLAEGAAVAHVEVYHGVNKYYYLTRTYVRYSTV